MPIAPHVFEPVPMQTYSIPPPPELCRFCGYDRRQCAEKYALPEGGEDEGQE